jgi:hypothetical protein
MRHLAPGRSLRQLSAALAAHGVLARSGTPFEAKTLSRLGGRESPAVADRATGHRSAA